MNHTKNHTFSVNDFFCGAGGLSLGFHQAGFSLAGAWDIDQYAIQSFQENISPLAKLKDIRDMTYKDVPTSTVFAFGFPCTDLSMAGKRKGMIKGKTRSGLFYEVMRILEEIKTHQPQRLPSILLAENVKGVKPYLKTIEKEYEQLGYTFQYVVYNSKDFGVPQSRERYFLLGIRRDITNAFTFPLPPLPDQAKLEDILLDSVDEKYLIKGSKKDSIINRVLEKHPLIQQLLIDDTYGYGGVRLYKELSPTLRSGRQGQKILRFNGIINDEGRRKKELKLTPLSPTLRAEEHGNQKKILEFHDKFILRKLTPREYARLQGFPDDFQQIVSDTQFYRQMGNAVSVPVARHIAMAILDFLEQHIKDAGGK